jgi:hypothetical protein
VPAMISTLPTGFRPDMSLPPLCSRGRPCKPLSRTSAIISERAEIPSYAAQRRQRDATR